MSFIHVRFIRYFHPFIPTFTHSSHSFQYISFILLFIPPTPCGLGRVDGSHAPAPWILGPLPGARHIAPQVRNEPPYRPLEQQKKNMKSTIPISCFKTTHVTLGAKYAAHIMQEEPIICEQSVIQNPKRT